jgi:hypothetical protein
MVDGDIRRDVDVWKQPPKPWPAQLRSGQSAGCDRDRAAKRISKHLDTLSIARKRRYRVIGIGAG